MLVTFLFQCLYSHTGHWTIKHLSSQINVKVSFRNKAVKHLPNVTENVLHLMEPSKLTPLGFAKSLIKINAYMLNPLNIFCGVT